MTDHAPNALPLAPTIPGPDPAPRRPQVKFPAGACDSHVHIFGPQQSYPPAPNPGYIPHETPLTDLWRMLRTIGCDRAVIVQPTFYGFDNRCVADALRTGEGQLRGVAGIDLNTSEEALEDLHRLGVRGIRLHLKGNTLANELINASRLAERIRARGWHIQFQLRMDTMPDVAGYLAKLPVDIVIDHFGYVSAANGMLEPGFQALLRLSRTERCWFKLSAPYRLSKQPPQYHDVVPLVRALVAMAPDRCVWGTDWPHATRNDSGMLPIPNDGDLADMLADWIPDDALRHRVLVENPRRLYDFDRSG